ncbi:MAG: Polynucleotide adenylyltransferase region [Synergistales bacterium 54_9]|nr:MAG: Polynucleotide adenylyltransferase region [Synergistales bacterium 54_9]
MSGLKVITTHIGADFDSLASMIAAAKLYKGAVPCFSGAAGRNVRDFLKRQTGRWEILTPRQVNMDEITTLVVVDARSPSRIADFAAILGRPRLSVHVYDHHPAVQEDISADFVVIEPVGATTTILVERLIEKGIYFDPQEATLFAMGVYEDTGGLTFGSTTERDIQVFSRLRALGADMTAIPAYIEMSLDPAERRIQDKLVENAREIYVHGAKIVLSAMVAHSYVEGLSLFVHRLRDYFDADVALVAVQMEKRTYVVARSREEILDVAKFLAPLGGGGHPQAASVTLAGTPPSEILAKLEERLLQTIEPAVTVKEVMTSPVLAIDPGSSVEDAYRIMIRYGHAALPVVEDGALVGIITRKDLDKAKIHGLGQVAVGDFMTEGPITIRPEASVAEAHRIMVLNNIGRLPVVDESTLSGIVTRTDILRALYPRSLPSETRSIALRMPWTENVSELLSQELKPWVLQLLVRLGERAESMGIRAYVVGGFVRDLLLGRPNEDLDIVIEGDALVFIKSWEADGCHVAVHQRFKTGTIVFPGGRKVDVATARREFYEYPVAQPKVLSDSLKHDLYRRDFSVNAMAVSINRSLWGTLIDYFGGRRDLQKKSLRVLHNLSFVEDPTRVIRGVRLEQRLGFRLEENTLRLLKNSIRGGLVSLLSGVKLRSELELVFTEKAPHVIVRRFRTLGFWKALFRGVNPGPLSIRTMRRITVFRRRLARDLPEMGKYAWLAFLCALICEANEEDQLAVLDRLHLNPRERKIVEEGVTDLGPVENTLGERGEKTSSYIFDYLEDVHPVTAIYWAAATERWRARRRILLYLTRLRKIEPMLEGRDLLDLGYKEGPRIGKILRILRMARLDGLVETREDEIEWVLGRFQPEFERM